MVTLNIKEEFKRLIPPLSKEEYAQLEENCLNEGIRDPIILWNGFIIDGHNRYEIALGNGLPYATMDKEFESEDDVIIWMCNNQLGRRNLAIFVRYELTEQIKEALVRKGKSTQGTRTDLLSIIDNKLPENNTRKVIAEKLNKSTGWVGMADVVAKKAPDALKEKLRTGEVSVNQVYQDIKKEEKAVVLEEKKRQNAINLSIEVAENKPVVYNMDCIDFLNTLENDSVDLLITDPPYSTDVKDINQFANMWVLTALSKVKPSGRAYICIGGYPKEINAYLNVLLSQDKFIVDNPLIWSYKNTLGITPKMKYNLNYQVILHLYSELSSELDTSITSEMWNVMEINAPDGRIGNRYHTWQKPDELAMRLIKHSTKESDLIVDCFACTGTFLLMGAKLNRIAKGCDIDFDNLQIAKDRGCTIIGA